METQPVPRRDRSSRLISAALIALLLAVGAGIYLREGSSTGASVGVAAAPPALPVVAIIPPERPASALPEPTFDIVRVSPDGQAVIAGQARPGDDVTLRDGDRTLGQARADRNGAFVVVPSEPLMPGGRELTLASRGNDGQERQSAESVIVMVPPPKPLGTAGTPSDPAGTAPAQSLAVLLPRSDAPPKLLPPASGKTDGLALNTVDYDHNGDIRFAGSAPPSAPVRVYVDNKAAGEAKAGSSGQWALTPPSGIEPGLHQLRVDQLGRDGRVAGRVELPFQRSALSERPGGGSAEPAQTVVQPGQNLWRIARQAYGTGTRYTVIVLANRGQSRDPNRIYPGQVFATPDE